MDREVLARRAGVAIAQQRTPAADEFSALRDVMRTYLLGAWPSLSAAAVNDTVDETITRLLTSPQAVALPAAELLPYVLRMARNVQVQTFRQRSREVPDGDPMRHEQTGDDAIAAALERTATFGILRQVVGEFDEAGDETAIAVLVEWLDWFELQGEAPTSRELSSLLAVSHTTVSRAMTRVRDSAARIAAQGGGGPDHD